MSGARVTITHNHELKIEHTDDVLVRTKRWDARQFHGAGFVVGQVLFPHGRSVTRVVFHHQEPTLLPPGTKVVFTTNEERNRTVTSRHCAPTKMLCAAVVGAIVLCIILYTRALRWHGTRSPPAGEPYRTCTA